MENQGAAGALQLSQEVDDERLGRHVFNLHSTTLVKGSESGRCGFIASGVALKRRDRTDERAGHLAMKW